MRLYLDACIVIYLVERHPVYESRIRNTLGARSGAQLCWTDLTRMEARLKPLRESNHSLLAHFDHFFGEPVADHVFMGRAVFDRATTLRAEHGLKTPDALHLAAAIEGECEEFWTNDHRLERAAGNTLRVVTFSA